MNLEIVTGPFIPHLLETKVDDTEVRAVARAFVLGGVATGVADASPDAGVGGVLLVVVLRLLVGAALGLRPAFEWR